MTIIDLAADSSSVYWLISYYFKSNLISTFNLNLALAINFQEHWEHGEQQYSLQLRAACNVSTDTQLIQILDKYRFLQLQYSHI